MCRDFLQSFDIFGTHGEHPMLRVNETVDQQTESATLMAHGEALQKQNIINGMEKRKYFLVLKLSVNYNQGWINHKSD
jgi:hypothetical protein